MNRLTRFGLAPLALLLGGCGSGDGTTASSEATSDYLPSAIGNRWTYTSSAPGAPSSAEARFLEKLEASDLGDNVATYKRRGFPLTVGRFFYFAYYKKTASALTLVFPPEFQSFPGPLGTLDVLRLPLRSGDHYFAYNFSNHDYGDDLDGDGINETIDLSEEITVGGVETVTVPLGTFSDALKVSSHYYQRVTGSTDGSPHLLLTADTDSWYVPGIGLIKSSTSQDSGYGSTTSQRVLTGLRINGVSTDVVAPTVSSTFPAHLGTTSSLTAGEPTWITMTFSEDMDPSSVAPFSATGTTPFVIRNANTQQPVSGTVSYEDRQLLFVPDAAMPADTYTAELTGATDALGNALPTYNWIFSIH